LGEEIAVIKAVLVQMVRTMQQTAMIPEADHTDIQVPVKETTKDMVVLYLPLYMLLQPSLPCRLPFFPT
jgi:hypothetical protein